MNNLTCSFLADAVAASALVPAYAADTLAYRRNSGAVVDELFLWPILDYERR